MTRPIAWRERQLDALVRLLDEGEDRLVEALAADVGKPRMEGWATDIGVTAAEIKVLRKNVGQVGQAPPGLDPPDRHARPGPGPARAAGHRADHRPVELPGAAPDRAAGRRRSPPATPRSSSRPSWPRPPPPCSPTCSARTSTDAVQVVEGGPEVATELLEQRWDHIFFTGSTRIGQVVAEAAAKHLTPVTLELGGKSPAIVHQSANLEVAGRRIAWGKFLNAGQTCIAPDYVLVDESVQDELVEHIRSAVRDFYGDDPQASDDYARIVNGRHFDRLSGLLDGGGKPALGGETDADTRYIAPTVLVDTPDGRRRSSRRRSSARCCRCCRSPRWPTPSTAINARPKPLALYVFADDDDAVDAVLARTSSGGVCVNHTLVHIMPPELPFGGVGDSGQGRYHGKSGFDTFSNLKSVLRKPTRPDPALLYPPYTRRQGEDRPQGACSSLAAFGQELVAGDLERGRAGRRRGRSASGSRRRRRRRRG